MMYQYLLKLADEFQKHLTKSLYPSGFSEYEKILLQLGIIPIEHERHHDDDDDDEDKNKRVKARKIIFGKSFIDEGAFTKVFKVIYRGKPAVAKLTSSKQDFNQIKKLNDLSKKIGKYKKHIPIVYDFFIYNELEEPLYIAIVEELKPLNMHVAELFNSMSDDEFKVKRLLQTLNVKFFTNFFIKHNLHKILSKNNFVKLCSESENFYKTKDISKNNLLKIIEEYRNIVNKYIDNIELTNKLSQELYFYINSILCNEYNFPDSFYNLVFWIKEFGTFPHKFLPETKSFMECLIMLHDKFGIRYSDLSDANIMERPGTNDIVIADPGNFV